MIYARFSFNYDGLVGCWSRGFNTLWVTSAVLCVGYYCLGVTWRNDDEPAVCGLLKIGIGLAAFLAFGGAAVVVVTWLILLCYVKNY